MFHALRISFLPSLTHVPLPDHWNFCQKLPLLQHACTGLSRLAGLSKELARIMMMVPGVCVVKHLLQVRRPDQGGQPRVCAHPANQLEAQDLHLPSEVRTLRGKYALV